MRDYDPAIRFFVDVLQCELVEDVPSLTNDRQDADDHGGLVDQRDYPQAAAQRGHDSTSILNVRRIRSAQR